MSTAPFFKDSHMSTEYPKWLYHASEDPKIVNDPDEHEALGEGWRESPVEPEVKKRRRTGKAKSDSATGH
jgi:hypothetical protein